MIWIAQAIANLTMLNLWNMIAEAGLSMLAWAFDKLPPEVRDWFEDSYFSQAVAFFGEDADLMGGFPSAMKFGYDLFTWFVPLQSLVTQLLVVLTVVGAIRLARWIIRVIPNMIVGNA